MAPTLTPASPTAPWCWSTRTGLSPGLTSPPRRASSPAPTSSSTPSPPSALDALAACRAEFAKTRLYDGLVRTRGCGFEEEPLRRREREVAPGLRVWHPRRGRNHPDGFRCMYSPL